MINIELKDVCKDFHKSKGTSHVLHDVNLSIQEGEIVAFRGDNGIGKTTLLNLIAGIESLTSGTIEFRNRNSSSLTIGYVQQDYTSSLLPWFDVVENVAIPLRLRGIDKKSRMAKAVQVIESLGFSGLPLEKYPSQLSGGQKQRTAIARAIVGTPMLLLLDEPFSNLDAHTSRDLQETLSRVHVENKPTIIYVSHELDHCIYLADTVVLMHGAPATIHRTFEVDLPRPRNREQILSREFGEIRGRILQEEEQLYARAK